MDQPAPRQAPYFDLDLLREEASQLAHAYSGQDNSLRKALVERLRQLVDDAHASAKRQLEQDGDGRACAEGLSAFQDALIRLAYDFTTNHIYRVDNPSTAERMAVVAQGGYGRGLLAPGSDIDLLFLLPYKQTAWGESVAEYMLYLLWDLGFKVGHATRTIDQCVRLSHSDMTIRTALLDARLILGDAALYADFQHRFRKEVLEGNARPFIEAKLAEQNARHARAGASRYLVEPNIKDGKGGLRDLHTLHWLAKHLYPDKAEAEFVEAGVFTPHEYRSFRRCESFLWTVRCELHFLTDRPEERLGFDIQQPMAERLGYRSKAGLSAVERFMRHYFLVAKEVGELTGIVCSALEMKQLKSLPSLDTILAPFSWRRRARLRRTSDFRIENGRIYTINKDVFAKDKVNFIRLFVAADENQASFSPEVLRQVRANFRLIDDDLRNNPTANRLFLRLLTDSRDPEGVLRKMNEAGVLGRFIGDFGRVVSMMQFNMYHHFTVDEHLIRTIGYLSGIERGKHAIEHPVSTEIVRTIDNRRALYVAALVHDIAKGREEDHSIAGARIARELGPRFGLTPAETETAAWLVEHHLAMSLFAQSRDLNDPKTIRDFAALVQSRERLKLLLLLTVADIQAVGPGVWTGWKGQLLRTLYFETEPLLGGGHLTLTRSERVSRAQDALRERLAGWPRNDLERFIDRHYPSYWLRTDLDVIAEHAKLIRDAEAQGKTARHPHRHRRLPRRHRDHAARAEPPAPAGAGRRRLHRRRRQHRRCPDLDHARRHGARHHPSRARVRPGRGRGAPRQAHRPDHRAPAEGRGAARRGGVLQAQAEAAALGLHRPAASGDRQHSVRRADRDRDQRARPSRPALRRDARDLRHESRHRLGPYRHLRREGGRRVLRHRPDRQEDHELEPRSGDPRAPDQGAASPP